ncbi:MAG: hypothetical protein K2X58_14085 [Pseudomonadaceae bacterium]|nr:hypothetical protein [Pseudomonadaceae bacterium]
MKMINKLMVVLGLAAALVGCDHPDMLSSGQIKWEPVASDYLNKHKGKPNGAHSDWKLEIKDDQGIQIVSVFVDGKKKAWTGCNPTNGVVKPVTSACHVIDRNAVIAIHWNESEGYRVGTAAGPRFGGSYDLPGEQALDFISGMGVVFQAKGYNL